MKYIEDYVSEQLIDEIDAELEKVYDNEEFAICCLSSLDSDDEARLLLDFLKTNHLTKENRYKIIIFLLDMEKARN